jgi:hypothetical protein
MDKDYPDVGHAIAKELVISDDTRAKLQKALEEFNAKFKITE